MNMGANEFTIEELEALFNSDSQTTTPASTDDDTDAQDGNNGTAIENPEGKPEGEKSNNVENTKAFATRLRESTDKARKEEREAIAKSFGYDSYDAMIKARERQTYEAKGLDPEEVAPIVEELVKQRLESDPRMQELEGYRKQHVVEFAKKELAEITKLTNGEITSLTQLSKSVVDRWKVTGSLKSAFLELEGENLINKVRNEQSKGSTYHMQTPSGNSVGNDTQRPLNEHEKQIWRFFNPDISEDALNKKFIEK